MIKPRIIHNRDYPAFPVPVLMVAQQGTIKGRVIDGATTNPFRLPTS